MKNRVVGNEIIFCVVVILVFSSFSVAQGIFEYSDVGSSIVGEHLDRSTISDGYVESMDAAIARDYIRELNSHADSVSPGPHHGIWKVPSSGASYYPHSGEHYVLNKWGDTVMGIGFPSVVDVSGAWFAGQGGSELLWTSGVRVIGYRDGVRVGVTEWFRDIDEVPSWFAIDLESVDRIVVESEPVYYGGGWYAMDDLTYKVQNTAETIVIDFEDSYYHQELTGSGFAGLMWETGVGQTYDSKNARLGYVADKSVEVVQEPVVRGNPPALLKEFQGVIRGDATSWSYPPDSCGAVGPDHYVDVVNRNFAVYDKETGDELINMLLGDFLPGSNGDPRVLYDQFSERWFVIVCDFNTKIFVAVSTSDDATGSWFKFDFVVSQGADAGKWPDYPTLGVDEDGVYMGAYMIGGGSGMSIFALEKAPLIASNPYVGNIYAFRNLPYEGAIQPVHTYGNVVGEYFVSRASSVGLRVRHLTGMLTTPVLTDVCVVPVPSHSSPPDAPALGSSVPLDTVGHRLMNAVYRDGYIWTAHCIGLGGRAASRWYKIDVDSVLLDDYGTIDDPVLYYFFPTVMVNANHDMIIGFSGSCNNQYAAAYYTGRLNSDPSGETAPPVLLKEGEATYNLIDGYGRNRWGDYSLCALDPETQTFWTIQEYAHSHNATGENRWGTWIAEVAFNQPPSKPTVPTGPDTGVTDVDYVFSGVTTDPEGDEVSYRFDWGDGNISNWVGPYASGVSGSASYQWMHPGDYLVRVKAKDAFSESSWSDPHTLTILGGPILDVRPLSSGLLRVTASIRNNGETDAVDVNWSINLDGGLILMGQETTGTIDQIGPGEIKEVTSRLVVGFGQTKIVATAEIGGGSTDFREQSAFVLLFYVNVVPGGG